MLRLTCSEAIQSIQLLKKDRFHRLKIEEAIQLVT